MFQPPLEQELNMIHNAKTTFNLRLENMEKQFVMTSESSKWYNHQNHQNILLRNTSDRKLASVLKCINLYRSNKIYKIRIHRDCFNLYSGMSLLLRMFVKWGVH